MANNYFVYLAATSTRISACCDVKLDIVASPQLQVFLPAV